MAIAAPPVEAALAELTTFQRDFERLFLVLAEGVPILNQTIEDLTVWFGTLDGSQGGIGRQVEAEVEAMVTGSRAAAQAVLQHSEAGLAAAGALGSVATSLAARLNDAQQVSLRLRVAGLNASFAVDGLGARGAAFAAVNRALVDVADEAAGLAEAMSAGAHATSGAASALGTEQQALARQIADVTAATEARSRDALVACAEVLARLGGELAAVAARGKEVLGTTARLMLTIQRQDILRQGLDHVILVLRALQEEHRRVAAAAHPAGQVMAFLSFQEHAARLSAQLLHSLRAQLEALVGSVLEPVQDLSAAASLIMDRVRDPGAIERSVASPADFLADGFRDLPTLEGPLGACQTRVAALEGQIASLRPKLALLEQIPLQINLVAVLMKIEIASSSALAGAATIAADVSEVSRKFRELHLATSEAVLVLKDPLARVRAAVERQRGAWASLRRLPASIELGAGRVRAIAGAFRAQLAQLGEVGAELERTASELGRDLAAFRASVALTEGLQATCAGWSEEARRLRARLAERGLASEDEPGALRALIERFTIFEHRQLALGEAGPTTDRAEGPGELTLF